LPLRFFFRNGLSWGGITPFLGFPLFVRCLAIAISCYDSLLLESVRRHTANRNAHHRAFAGSNAHEWHDARRPILLELDRTRRERPGLERRSLVPESAQVRESRFQSAACGTNLRHLCLLKEEWFDLNLTFSCFSLNKFISELTKGQSLKISFLL
jgi:hypothetical protein